MPLAFLHLTTVLQSSGLWDGTIDLNINMVDIASDLHTCRQGP